MHWDPSHTSGFGSDNQPSVTAANLKNNDVNFKFKSQQSESLPMIKIQQHSNGHLYGALNIVGEGEGGGGMLLR